MTINRLTPLEELRREKEIVRRECKESEERLAGHWVYLSDNAGSLLFQSAVNVVLGTFGFGGNKKEKEETSISNSLLSGLTAYYPVIWDFARPLLWRYFIKKIKSLFSGKKKKKRRDEDD